ncbi:energy transducer TonB [Acetobacter sp. TBRC 12305]|uniref:TonB family protein n=2 Tax=Acetobacter garciniae TaxID=2817435 RepID=A0A939HN92_9PROT|nr:TonB family protein [Acetobacter garciniae]MBX0344515.1 energy transducer TonB [Acetobacter garciniae]
MNKRIYLPPECASSACPPGTAVLLVTLNKNGHTQATSLRQTSDTVVLDSAALGEFYQATLPVLPKSFPDVLYTLRIEVRYFYSTVVPHFLTAHYALLKPETSDIEQTDPTYKKTLQAWMDKKLHYPTGTRAQGSCSVHVVMDRAGHVKSVTVIHSSGSSDLDAATRGLFTDAQLPPVEHGTRKYYDFDTTMTYVLKSDKAVPSPHP